MLYTGKLLYVELYDTMGGARTDVKRVWEARRSRHPGRCIVTNAHWFDPGPRQCGNYKVDGVVLSNQWPDALTGFGWNTGEPKWTSHMGNYNNFVCTIPALINGERQKLDYGAGVERATTRTWFGRKADGTWSVEVTTANYTLDGIVDRMAALGITDGMVFDGSGSSQWYDGERHITGDGRTIYSYLLLWFDESSGDDDGGDENMKKGIDVSQWQGTIDWEKVKAAGVEFAMLRAGYGQGNFDPQYTRNANECTRLGIPFGVYWFSYAYTVEMAEKEADYCLKAVAPYDLSYPIAFDFEYDSVDRAADKGVSVTKQLASDMARAFLNKIEANGYYGMIYANSNYLSQYFDADIPERYDVWLAQWPRNPAPTPKPAQAGGMWQYSSSGAVDGITGRVDMNYAYYDYPSIIAKLSPVKPDKEDTPAEPQEPEKEDKPMSYEEEKAAATAWAQDNGISDGTRPYDSVQRVELLVMLWRVLGKKEDPSMSYEEEKAAATAWAQENGVSDGTRPYDPVQRVELWVMLWRLMGGEK